MYYLLQYGLDESHWRYGDIVWASLKKNKNLQLSNVFKIELAA